MASDTDRLLVSRKNIAALLDVPLRTLSRLESTSAIPGRVMLGTVVRYDVQKLRRWRDAGFPPAERWEEEQNG